MAKNYPGAGPSGMGEMPMSDDPAPHAGFDAMENEDMPMPTSVEYE